MSDSELTVAYAIAQLLEDILDDDADMADMYLGRRAQLSATTALQADVAVDADSEAGPDPVGVFRDDLLNQEAAPEQSGGSMAEMLCKSRRRRSSTTG